MREDDHPTGAASTTPQARTERGRLRREAVLDAAASLFLEHGFHGASVDDVGAAAGITGPGLYRHFPSKDALLMAVLDRLWGQLKPSIEAAVRREPADALALLVDAHVDLALDQPAALMLLIRELRHLPDDYRAAARRNLRRYVDAWAAPLQALAPHLDGDAATAAAMAVHGLVDSAALFPDVVPAGQRRVLLRRLARAALAEALVVPG